MSCIILGGSYSTVTTKKARALHLKFEDRYLITATSNQRTRRKARGQANAQLLMWPEEQGGPIHWWLLASEGEGLVHQLETLNDCRSKPQRIQITGYELVKTPRKGKGAQARWSWRMTQPNYQTWQERLRTGVRRKNDDLIRQALFSLRRVPGFSESRKQAFALERYAKAEWERTQRGNWPYAGIFVGWLGRYQKPTILQFSDL